MQTRQPIIIGNWKMNHNISDSIRLITELKGSLSGKQVAEIAVAPSMVRAAPEGAAHIASAEDALLAKLE